MTVIRKMIRHDTDAIANFGIGEDALLATLRQPRNIGVVLEEKCEIIGLMLYEVNKSHFEIIHLSILPEFRRMGHGTTLLTGLKKALVNQRNAILAIAKESDLPTQLLLKSNGFTCNSIIKGTGNEPDEYQFCYTRE